MTWLSGRLRVCQRASVCGCLLLAMAFPALATPSLDDYFREWPIRDFALSPDGTKLAGIYRDGRQFRLAVLDLEDGNKPLYVEQEQKDLSLAGVHWLNNKRVAVSSFANLGWGSVGVQIDAINPDGTNRQSLIENAISMERGGAASTGGIASVIPEDPDHVAIFIVGKHGATLYKVNLETGGATEIASGPDNTIAFYLTPDGQPILRLDRVWFTRMVTLHRLDRARGKWRKVRSYGISERGDELVEDILSLDGESSLLALERRDGDRFVKLHRQDIETQAHQGVVAGVPGFDLHGTVADPNLEEIVGVSYADRRLRYRYFDAGWQAIQAQLEAAFPDSEVVLISIGENGNRALFIARDVHSPGAYFIYDSANRRTLKLGSLAPQLEDAGTSIEEVAWRSRDGVELGGYLTLPPNVDMARPLVIMPHGGPQARDWIRFDPMVQYLAIRGYAVFQPNFRGSSGFGREFEEAGYKQWDRVMLDDMEDGIRHLAKDKRVDTSRTCAFGMSYGGYAALMLAMRDGLTRCTVAVAAPTDLRMLIADKLKLAPGMELKAETTEWFNKTLGNRKKDKARLDAGSPVYRPGDVGTPVLLIHAVNDNLVPVKHSRKMHKALRRAKKSVEYHELPRGGHSLEKGAIYRVSELAREFIDQHIGLGSKR